MSHRFPDTLLDLFALFDMFVSSLVRGYANLLWVIPILSDDPRRESRMARETQPGNFVVVSKMT